MKILKELRGNLQGEKMIRRTEIMTQETVTITWGEETYAPIPYNTFRVGPITITSNVRPGETYAQAVSRVHLELEEIAMQVFLAKRNGFFGRHKATQQ